MKKLITLIVVLVLVMPAVSFGQATSAEAIEKSIQQIDQAIEKREQEIAQLRMVRLKQIGKLELLKDQEAEVKEAVEKEAEGKLEPEE
ncbi:MAG: hypothetical protein ABIA77_04235 [Candidatus Omnitrophota bacterium]